MSVGGGIFSYHMLHFRADLAQTPCGTIRHLVSFTRPYIVNMTSPPSAISEALMAL